MSNKQTKHDQTKAGTCNEPKDHLLPSALGVDFEQSGFFCIPVGLCSTGMGLVAGREPDAFRP